MTTTDSAAVAPTTNQAADLRAPAPGRCVYCDERCNVQATYHDYCRDEHELERLAAAARGARFTNGALED